MRQAIRPVFFLLIVLAILAWGASILVDVTSRRWLEQDVRLRAAVILSGRDGLVRSWADGDRLQVGRILAAIARDERVLGAAACGNDLETIAETAEYPAEIGCSRAGLRVSPQDRASPHKDGREQSRTVRLNGGRVHVSAVPVSDAGRPLGFVLLAQDLRFADLRAATSRWFTLAAFGVLAAAASLVTFLATRSSWLTWTSDLRRFLKGETPSREFQPVMRDVRDLAEQIAAESMSEGRGAAWTPDRLRRNLRRYLHGEKVIILANREPYIHERDETGTIRVLHPASGLVTALEPVMRAFSGVWVAHGSGSADREVSDRNGRVRVPPGDEAYILRRVWLTSEEEKGYYYGFSNEGLWPLCHIAHTRPTFRAEDWEEYQKVNRLFADAVCAEVDSPDPIVFVQDYHFALVPRLLRRRLPRATILSFWHIPWPNSEFFGICPWRRELLRGMLGSSILGFHTRLHCNNFLDTVDRFLEARIDREQRAVVQRGRTTLVRGYPISVEWPIRWLRDAPPVELCRREVRARYDLAPDALLGVGVDRLDYTKGIEERLFAVEGLLERHPRFRGRFTFVVLAAPSRLAIPRYQELRRGVEALAARINARFGKGDHRPIVLRIEHHEPPDIVRHYRAADVCFVSSLHDGMNLVAKEFVAARDDERGALLLSCFTGAARELTEALVVNPYDRDESSEALAVGLEMSEAEQRERMRAMRLYLSEFNVYRWAGQMLMDAARLRQRHQISDRLAERPGAKESAAQ
jgi:trehalose 6-phosphate synthase